jgi:cephalosporin hydroxylase
MSWSDLEGWCNFTDVYDSILAETGEYDVIVEVGVAHGRSLAYLARQAIDTQRRVLIYGVDRWLFIPWSTFMSGMGAFAPDELAYVCPLRARSVDAARYFADDSIAHVFIDAGHEYEDVRTDIEAWWPKVKKGGTLAGHDYSVADHPGVVKAVQEKFGNLAPVGAAQYCWQVRK